MVWQEVSVVNYGTGSCWIWTALCSYTFCQYIYKVKEFGVWSIVLFNDAWSHKGHSASNMTVILAQSYLLHLLLLHIIITFAITFSHLTLTLPSPSAGVSGSLDSYCSLKPLCSSMGEVVLARTSSTLLPPSPRTVLSLPCFKVSQCINCRDWHCKS